MATTTTTIRLSPYDRKKIAEEVFVMLREFMGASQPKKYMTGREAAAYLNMSEDHFSHICKGIPRDKVGGRYKYTVEGLNEFVSRSGK